MTREEALIAVKAEAAAYSTPYDGSHAGRAERDAAYRAIDAARAACEIALTRINTEYPQ